jgi:hypothetical protein
MIKIITKLKKNIKKYSKWEKIKSIYIPDLKCESIQYLHKDFKTNIIHIKKTTRFGDHIR